MDREEAEFADGLKSAQFTPSAWRSAEPEELYKRLVLQPLAQIPEQPLATHPRGTAWLSNSWWSHAVWVLPIVAILGISYRPLVLGAPLKLESKTYTTTAGQRASITLDDGSKVVLAPATTMRVTDRNVHLSGEALFTVTSRTDDPFTVTANSIPVKVLGTTFTVRKYAGDAVMRVVVAEGKVAFAGAVVATGDVATASSAKDVQVSRDMPLASFLDWTAGRLTFNHTPLVQAIPDIERWYGIEIEVHDPKLRKRPITASFEQESAQEAIQTLATILDAKAVRNGNVVTLTPNN